MELFVTVISGVLVFVLGQILLYWVIDPVQEFRKLRGEIVFLLANHHAAIHGAQIIDQKEAVKVLDSLHVLGAKLHSAMELIPCYSYTKRIFRLPPAEKLRFAAGRLRLMGNSMFGKNPDTAYRLDLYRIEICEALDVHDPIEDGMKKVDLIQAIQDLRQR